MSRHQDRSHLPINVLLFCTHLLEDGPSLDLGHVQVVHELVDGAELALVAIPPDAHAVAGADVCTRPGGWGWGWGGGGGLGLGYMGWEGWLKIPSLALAHTHVRPVAHAELDPVGHAVDVPLCPSFARHPDVLHGWAVGGDAGGSCKHANGDQEHSPSAHALEVCPSRHCHAGSMDEGQVVDEVERVGLLGAVDVFPLAKVVEEDGVQNWLHTPMLLACGGYR